MLAAQRLEGWPEGTVAILSTVGEGAPYAIPVSTAIRDGSRRVLLALARSRGSLARLRAEPRVALALLAEGDVAFTARGRASVVAESLPGADTVAAVALDVEEVDDHGRPAFAIDEGVRWHWLDDDARERDARVRAELRALLTS